MSNNILLVLVLVLVLLCCEYLLYSGPSLLVRGTTQEAFPYPHNPIFAHSCYRKDPNNAGPRCPPPPPFSMRQGTACLTAHIFEIYNQCLLLLRDIWSFLTFPSGALLRTVLNVLLCSACIVAIINFHECPVWFLPFNVNVLRHNYE